ncbi:crotonase/enoyl-CoA hydratase family protein [Oceanomicrobium pacificus]|uniref:Crotonase/enoyl-CoA hydratase family protein n=1 Tax=Oceanomicrobium pacificus TaxID=2692916 RepID=A0A6B0TSA5_9RHOB|nr:crotonase/enoyl-CoA hydratase family protein [Oceanomicrobium pacificus]MXU63893.1 crotonase/enoyl-CoA hydratase family protein [Oceanomicrobium pacificus]
MSQPTIRLDRDPRGIATLTLDQPDTHNALSPAMADALTAAAAEINADESLRAVILTGAGKSFCAGGDLGWMRAQFDGDRAQRIAEARRLAHMLRALDRLAVPLVGRINGQAFGGGIGMMSVCDSAIAVTGRRFGLTETRLGLIPATISPYVVARIGPAQARRVFASPKLWSSEELVGLNLAARVVDDADLDAAVEAEVAPYLDASPVAVRAAKALLRDLSPPIDDATVEMTVSRLADTWETEDAREGIAAFFSKRRPSWAS